VIVLPDIESLVVSYLKAHAVIGPLVEGRISGELNAKTARPAISVRVVSGISPIEWRLTTPGVQIDVWGENRQQTRELALKTNAALAEMTGNIQNLGIVSNVRTLIVPRPMPDADDPRPRYMFEVQVTARPIP
jgi:hypothetical protein